MENRLIQRHHKGIIQNKDVKQRSSRQFFATRTGEVLFYFTDLLSNYCKDFSILDFTLTDEQNTPMWTVSSAVQLVHPRTTDGIPDLYAYSIWTNESTLRCEGKIFAPF